MTNLVAAVLLLWSPNPETNIVDYRVVVNSVEHHTSTNALPLDLPPGSYHCKLLAVDSQGLESRATSFNFTLHAVTNTVESSTNLVDWTALGTNIYISLPEGQIFYRSRFTIH